MAQTGERITPDDIKKIKTKLEVNSKLENYIEYKLHQQKDRLNALVDSLESDSTSPPLSLSAKKAGSEGEVIAARKIDLNKIILYEQFDKLSSTLRTSLTEQGITLNNGSNSTHLGEGAFGSVELVRELDSKKWYAHKVIRDSKESINQEVLIIKNIINSDKGSEAEEKNFLPKAYVVAGAK